MRDRYFEGGISSVYFWDIDDGFAGCVLLKKCTFLDNSSLTFTNCNVAVSPTAKSSGTWDSIHVFESQDRARMSHYKLTSTVILNLGTATDVLGSMDLSGNMVRQVEQDMTVEDDNSHVINIGKVSRFHTLYESGLSTDPVACRWSKTWS